MFGQPLFPVAHIIEDKEFAVRLCGRPLLLLVPGILEGSIPLRVIVDLPAAHRTRQLLLVLTEVAGVALASLLSEILLLVELNFVSGDHTFGHLHELIFNLIVLLLLSLLLQEILGGLGTRDAVAGAGRVVAVVVRLGSERLDRGLGVSVTVQSRLELHL